MSEVKKKPTDTKKRKAKDELEKASEVEKKMVPVEAGSTLFIRNVSYDTPEEELYPMYSLQFLMILI